MLSLFLLLIEEESEQDKFETIYRKYSDDMYKLALKNTGNDLEAEDIVSESFLSVLDNIKIIKTENETALKAYLFRIVKNKYYDTIKKKANYTLNLESFDNIPIDSDIENDLAEKEQKEIIMKIILKMPDIYRYAFYFKYNENYSTRNIAKMFDLSEGTVRKILKDGVRYIINILREVEKNEKL